MAEGDNELSQTDQHIRKALVDGNRFEAVKFGVKAIIHELSNKLQIIDMIYHKGQSQKNDPKTLEKSFHRTQDHLNQFIHDFKLLRIQLRHASIIYDSLEEQTPFGKAMEQAQSFLQWQYRDEAIQYDIVFSQELVNFPLPFNSGVSCQLLLNLLGLAIEKIKTNENKTIGIKTLIDERGLSLSLFYQGEDLPCLEQLPAVSTELLLKQASDPIVKISHILYTIESVGGKLSIPSSLDSGKLHLFLPYQER